MKQQSREQSKRVGQKKPEETSDGEGATDEQIRSSSRGKAI